ncbi:MAG: hypothetical protein MPK09_01495 [Gammaproteobacteria bacterium]|nr:hypothetical protein [Gammaproteobacteria bacterium]
MLIALLYAAMLYGIYWIMKVPKWVGIVSVVIVSAFIKTGTSLSDMPEGGTILLGGAMCAMGIFLFDKRNRQKAKDAETAQ